MSPKQIINGLEIKFWQFAIPAIKKSKPLKKSFLLGYQGVQKYRVFPFPYQVGISLLISLSVGLMIGLLSK